MNLPPSSRLEISSCNRTTSFHHTPLLYWVPSAKRNPLFLFHSAKLVRSTGRREKSNLRCEGVLVVHRASKLLFDKV